MLSMSPFGHCLRSDFPSAYEFVVEGIGVKGGMLLIITSLLAAMPANMLQIVR